MTVGNDKNKKNPNSFKCNLDLQILATAKLCCKRNILLKFDEEMIINGKFKAITFGDKVIKRSVTLFNENLTNKICIVPNEVVISNTI